MRIVPPIYSTGGQAHFFSLFLCLYLGNQLEPFPFLNTPQLFRQVFNKHQGSWKQTFPLSTPFLFTAVLLRRSGFVKTQETCNDFPFPSVLTRYKPKLVVKIKNFIRRSEQSSTIPDINQTTQSLSDQKEGIGSIGFVL